ncbi:MAG: DUF192 domain-containing protein [Gammaproteobacteria bacterium]
MNILYTETRSLTAELFIFAGKCCSGLFLAWLTGCTMNAIHNEWQDLSIITKSGDEVTYRIEVADNNISRMRGLMYRKNLPADQGMLLDFNSERHVAIWMKNTYIPLDILFINADGVIIKIARKAEPLSRKRIKSDLAVRAVLELNANQVMEHGIGVGDRVQYR